MQNGWVIFEFGSDKNLVIRMLTQVSNKLVQSNFKINVAVAWEAFNGHLFIQLAIKNVTVCLPTEHDSGNVEWHNVT